MLAEVVRKLLVIILFLAAFVFLVAILPKIADTAWPLGSEPVLPGPPSYNLLEIEDRMRYHGVQVAWQDKKGQWWFYRAGKPCRLRKVGGANGHL